MFDRFQKRIAEKTATLSAAPVLIVALGDSVTQGCMAINVIDHVSVYHNVLKGMLEEKYPLCTFSVINAGVGGDSAAGGCKRLNRDVIRHAPDLLIVGFCLNDSGMGRDGIPQYQKSIGEIVQRTRAETEAEILLLTPNFMVSRDNERIAEQHRQLTEAFIKRQTDGTLKAYSDALKEVGVSMNVPVADVFAEWERLAASGADTTAMLTNGLNHPDAERHRLIADTIMSHL